MAASAQCTAVGPLSRPTRYTLPRLLCTTETLPWAVLTVPDTLATTTIL